MKSNKCFMLAASFLILAGTVGCSGTTTEVASYPNPQCMHNSNQDVVRDEASGKIVHSSSGACVRTNWIVENDQCAEAAAHRNVAVYFGSNQTSLTPESIAQLDALVASLKGAPKGTNIHIIGFADRIGKAAHNAALSKARAENVRQYLIAKGLVQAKLAKTVWVGDTKASANCPSTLKRAELNSCLKQDRRVEVEVSFSSEAPAKK